MVPRCEIRSSRFMPMPLSDTVRVLLSLSSATVILNSGSSATRPGSVRLQVAQLVAGVGGVGDQLAQKDRAVAVERMCDDIQEARHLGLESELFHLHGLTLRNSKSAR